MEMTAEEIAQKAHEKGTNILLWGDLGHLLKRINIDRRKCYRIVLINILALGPSRCGISNTLFNLAAQFPLYSESPSDERGSQVCGKPCFC
jgi:hypothetical protein